MLKELGIEIVAVTSHGRRRRNNADAYLIDEAAGLLAVADGMGDSPRSAAKARMALEAVRELFVDRWQSRPPEVRSIGEAKERLRLGVMQANRRLFVPPPPGEPRRGTTFVGVVLSAERFCVTSVGDSRAYLLRRGVDHMVPLTRDDTVLDRLLSLGVPYEVAIEHPQARSLTRAVGAVSSVDVEPVIYKSQPGETLLLCSDGLTDWVPSTAIAATLAEADDLERAATRLIERAKDAGGCDDATVVIARRASSAARRGESGGQEIEALRMLGVCLVRAGRQEEAQRAWRQAQGRGRA